MAGKQAVDAIYELDGKISVGKAIPFGLQHILAMFVANIAPILIVAGVLAYVIFEKTLEKAFSRCFFSSLRAPLSGIP